MPAHQKTPPRHPTILYDGECGFCLRSVRRLQQWVGPRVRLIPYQNAGQEQIDIPQVQLATAIHLIQPDGQVLTGAGAILFAAAVYGRRPWASSLWWSYKHLPAVARIAESIYRRIAARRRRCPLPAPNPNP